MALPPAAAGAGVPPHWMAYVGTDDVDATVDQATGLGGRVMVPPTDIPSVGRFAVLGDPQGAVFAAFQPGGESPGRKGDPGRGDFSWHELATTDHAGALAFYAALFGWVAHEAIDMGPGGTYQIYGLGGRALGGMFTKPAGMPGPPHWLLYVSVEDIDHALAEATRRGGRLLNGPMQVPGGTWIAQCQDPQGAGFALHASTRKA